MDVYIMKDYFYLLVSPDNRLLCVAVVPPICVLSIGFGPKI